MISDINSLPDDSEALKQIIVLYAQNEHRYEAENNLLRKQIRLLRAQLFGRKTEKIPPEAAHRQLLLFNEAKETVSEQPPKSENVALLRFRKNYFPYAIETAAGICHVT